MIVDDYDTKPKKSMRWHDYLWLQIKKDGEKTMPWKVQGGCPLRQVGVPDAGSDEYLGHGRWWEMGLYVG